MRELSKIDIKSLEHAQNQLATREVREMYYNSYCYIQDLHDFSHAIGNDVIKEHITIILDHLETVHKELNVNYNWE